jgi:hypothetical protein
VTAYLNQRGNDTIGVTYEVVRERGQQDRKFGEQNHPDGTSKMWQPEADLMRQDCEEAFAGGQGTWKHILLEEVAEAIAEEDVKALRNELIQVAAVAVAWVEAIDRRECETNEDQD